MNAKKVLEKEGFVFYEDSRSISYVRRYDNDKLFDQIKFSKEDKYAEAATYYDTDEEGFKKEPLPLKISVAKAIVAQLNDIYEKEKQK